MKDGLPTADLSVRVENRCYDDLVVITNESKCDAALKLHLSTNDHGKPLFVFPSTCPEVSKIVGARNEPVLDLKKPPPIGAPIKNTDNGGSSKFANVSLDCVQTKKEECPLLSCPSLDTCLAIGTNHNGTFLPLLKASTAVSSPSGRLTSLGSLDSGVLSSALSFEMANVSRENSKRSRIASSVSSGTCDMWQESIDGDATVPLSESLIQVSDAVEPPWPSFLKKSARSDNLNSCLKPVEQRENKLIKPSDLNADQFLKSDVNRSSSIETKSFGQEMLSSQAMTELWKFATKLVAVITRDAITQSLSKGWSIKCSVQCSEESCMEDFKKQISSRKETKTLFSTTLGLSSCSSSLCWTSEVPFSPHRSKRSSISFSHDSLMSSSGPVLDDSHLITGAVSHDTLTFTTNGRSPSVKKKIKNCMECLNTDIYSMPIDTLKPYQGTILQPKVITRQPKRRSQTRSNKGSVLDSSKRRNPKLKRIHKVDSQRTKSVLNESSTKTTMRSERQVQPILRSDQPEVVVEERSNSDLLSHDSNSSQCLESRKISPPIKQSRILSSFSSTKNSKRNDDRVERKKSRSFSSNIRNTLVTLFTFKRNRSKEIGNSVNAKNEFMVVTSQTVDGSSDKLKWGRICPLPSAPPLRNCVNGSAFTDTVPFPTSDSPPGCKKPSSSHIPQQRQSNNSISPSSLLSCLRNPRTNSIDHDDRTSNQKVSPASSFSDSKSSAVKNRALPPLPSTLKENSLWNTYNNTSDEGCDFASIIEKVKNYGWYWGPISGEAAEKVLSNEPDGSFIVRDSSDYHYIFSLTFRLNGVTRHVRIEHDQGNFSFGGFTRFKSQTIVDFIEKAVEHSRSGRYLFFLHRRPVLGPMRVQLLHPVSRLKHVQSLQHMCRFVIVKRVRKDLIPSLPLPKRLKDYLNSPHYYSEQVEQCMSTDATSSPKVRHDSGHRLVSSEAEASSSSTRLFLNLRSSFPTAIEPRSSRRKNARLCSSQSSLETMQASALPNDPPAWTKDVPHSSPSSPVPFDLSTTDWFSSSEDLFRFRKSSKLVLRSPRHQRRSLNLDRSRGARKTKCQSASNNNDNCDNKDGSSTISD